MRATSWATAAVLGLIGALVSYGGVQILSFAGVSASLEDATAKPALSDPGAPKADRVADIFGPWKTAPGLQAEARAIAVALAGREEREPSDRLASAIADLLAVRPTAAASWAELAEARLVAGESPESVLTALEMSAVMAPNEAAVMYRRVDLGLRLWDLLPAAWRDRTASDLALIRPRFGSRELTALRARIARKPPATRADIRERLAARDGQAAGWMGRLGL